MTSQEIAAINHERLDRWGRLLNERHATPIALIGVGHDHQAGELHVCIPEDGIERKQLVTLLRAAVRLIERIG